MTRKLGGWPCEECRARKSFEEGLGFKGSGFRSASLRFLKECELANMSLAFSGHRAWVWGVGFSKLKSPRVLST